MSNKNNKTLKPGWRRVRFGDVVRLSKARSQDPLTDGFERYVGLEHLEPGDLRIRNWGNVADGVTFTSVFQPGQVLFGKRRAYQRKVAVADFSGVCSGDIYVLETRDAKVLLQDLLPFICQTDAFFDHAVGTSAGSLSPRTNWTSLAEYEIALPPLNDQQNILAVLESAKLVADVAFEARERCMKLFNSSLEHLLSTGLRNEPSQIVRGLRYAKSWPMRPLRDIASVDRGKFSHRPRNLPQFFGGPYPFTQVTEIAKSTGTLVLCEQTLSEEGVRYSRSFPKNTVLISITGVVLAKTAVTPYEVWAPDSIVGIQTGADLDHFFLEFVLRRMHPLLNGSLATTSTTQKNINLETLRPLLVPCPTMGEQVEIRNILQAAQDAIDHCKRRYDAASQLLKQCSNLALTPNSQS
ncbi:restriction endonuclease subunit S [Ralstonia pseudosolanacearum]